VFRGVRIEASDGGDDRDRSIGATTYSLTSPATGVWFAGSPGAHECAITALPGTHRHRLGLVKLGGRRPAFDDDEARRGCVVVQIDRRGDTAGMEGRMGAGHTPVGDGFLHRADRFWRLTEGVKHDRRNPDRLDGVPVGLFASLIRRRLNHVRHLSAAF
jgi:hypothetical protein